MSKDRQINGETRGAYGSRRTSERLRSQGHDVGRYRARSLIKTTGVSPDTLLFLSVPTPDKFLELSKEHHYDAVQF